MTAVDKMDPQEKCPLFSLPGELRNMIYRLALAADDPFTDPSIRPISKSTLEDSGLQVIKSRHNLVPTTGIQLLRTCKRMAAEVDVRSLFASNTFRFTSQTHAHRFLRLVGPTRAACVRDVEMDVRDFSLSDPMFAAAMSSYLTFTEGVWSKKQGTLVADAPRLQTLKLDFSAWSKGAMPRAMLWDTLRKLLANIRGVERIVVRGVCKSPWMASREPWAAMHFCGLDEVYKNDLVELLWNAVGHDETDEKLICWSRRNGGLELDVSSYDYLSKTAAQPRPIAILGIPNERLPPNGSCDLSSYARWVEANPLFTLSR